MLSEIYRIWIEKGENNWLESQAFNVENTGI